MAVVIYSPGDFVSPPSALMIIFENLGLVVVNPSMAIWSLLQSDLDSQDSHCYKLEVFGLCVRQFFGDSYGCALIPG